MIAHETFHAVGSHAVEPEQGGLISHPYPSLGRTSRFPLLHLGAELPIVVQYPLLEGSVKLPLQRLETGQGGAAAVRYKVDVNRHRFEKLRVDVPLNGRYGRVLDSMVAFEKYLAGYRRFPCLGLGLAGRDSGEE